MADEAAMLRRLAAFVEAAAVRALALRDAGLAVSHKGADFAQALTEADTAISAAMRDASAPRLVEEETADGTSRAAAREMLAGADWSFVGDPIDGTAGFAAGLAGWGTMICACRDGWPCAGAALLPCWSDPRLPGDPETQPRGLLLAAAEGEAYWAPTLGGRPDALRRLAVPTRESGHVGWNAVAAQHYTLDYAQGFFPLCEGGWVCDVAALADGRMQATLFNHKFWDLAPTWPILAALGFALYRWPDLGPPPDNIVDLFDAGFACHPDLWVVARDRDTAGRLAAAIRRASVTPAPRPPA